MGGTGTMRLAGSPMGETRHACAFFRTEDEASRVLLPFIKDGFECGHKAIHIVAPDQEPRHVEHLTALGIDVDENRTSGQLRMLHSTDVYLSGDRFDPDRMLAAFEAMATASGENDFPLSRIVCNMDWVADHPLHHEDLIEFEARVNAVWQRHPDVVICVYDLKTLSGDMVVDIMRTHPLVLIGEVLRENPFFTPPEDFLRERRGRRSETVPSA